MTLLRHMVGSRVVVNGLAEITNGDDELVGKIRVGPNSAYPLFICLIGGVAHNAY